MAVAGSLQTTIASLRQLLLTGTLTVEHENTDDGISDIVRVFSDPYALLAILGASHGIEDEQLLHMAASVLRLVIERRWNAQDEVNALNIDEKREILSQLLTLLMERFYAKGSVRTAIAQVIAAIVEHDEMIIVQLIENLDAFVKNCDCSRNSDVNYAPESAQRIDALLQTILFSTENSSEPLIASAVPRLYPVIYSIVNRPSSMCPAYVKTQAVCLYRVSIEAMHAADDPQVIFKKFVLPSLYEFMAVYCTQLSNISSSELDLSTEIVRTLLMLTREHATVISKQHVHFFNAIFNSLKSLAPTFVSSALCGIELERLHQFLIEAFEYISSILRSKSVQRLFKPNLGHLIDLIIVYMQYPAVDATDADVFDDLDDDNADSSLFAVRLCAKFLLVNLLDKFEQTSSALVNSSRKQITSARCWREREAAVASLCIAGDSIAKHLDGDWFVNHVLIPDLSATTPLRFTAIKTVGVFVVFISQNAKLLEHCVRYIIGALSSAEHDAIRHAAVKALLSVLSEMKQHAIINSLLPTIFPAVINAISKCDDDHLHDVLDALYVVVNANIALAAEFEPMMTPCLVQTWLQHTSDRLTTECIKDVFAKIVTQKKVLFAVDSQIFPMIKQILCRSDILSVDQSALLDSALEFATLLLNAFYALQISAPVDYINLLLPAVVNIDLSSDDHTIIDSATRCLTAVVRACYEPLQQNPDCQHLLASIISVVSKLLQPSLSDDAAFTVGGLIIQLVYRMQQQLGASLIIVILRSVVARLYSSLLPSLSESLILIFARLVHSHGVELVNLLDNMGIVQVEQKEVIRDAPNPGEQYSSSVHYKTKIIEVVALHSVFQRWIDIQDDIHGVYPTKVSFTALSKLVLLDDPRINAINVRGFAEIHEDSKLNSKLGLNAISAPITRSRSRNGEQAVTYTSISFPVKVASLMIHAWRDLELARIAKQKAMEKRACKYGKNKDRQSDISEDDDDDDDWEESDSDDPESELLMDELVDRQHTMITTKSTHQSPFVDADSIDVDDIHSVKKFSGIDSLIHDAADDDDFVDEEYPDAKNDPLNGIDLQQTLGDWFLNLGKANRNALQALIYKLNADDQKMLHQLLHTTAIRQAQQRPNSL